MGLFISKKPRFIDLVYGLAGSYIGFEELKGEDGLVRPIIVPFNSLKAIHYPDTVHKEALTTITIGDPNKRGSSEQVVVLLENSRGESPFMEQLRRQTSESISSYKDKLAEKDLEIMTQKIRASHSKSESQKQVATDLELHEKKHGEREYDDTGSRFGSRVNRWNELEGGREEW